MATLSEYNAKGGVASARRGVLNPNLGAYKPVAETTMATNRPSNLQRFAEWGKSVAGTALNVAGAAAKATGKFAVNTGVDIAKTGMKAGTSLGIDQAVLTAKNSQIAQNSKDIDRIQQGIVTNYKAGKMSKEDYGKALQELAKIQGELSGESKKVALDAAPKERAMAVVETGATLLSTGSLKLANAGGKEVIQKGLTSAIDDGATILEKQILKNKAVRSLVERNLQSAAKTASAETTEQLMFRQGKDIAAGLLIKRPLFYQSNINDATSALEGVLTGNYPQALKSSAWIGLNMLNGGPIGYFLEKSKLGLGKLKQLSYGKDSFIDAVSSQTGDGKTDQIARFLSDLKNPKKSKGVITRAYHGSTDDKIESLVAGAKTGKNERRNLVYLAEDKNTAKNYTKVRGKDGNGLGELSDSPTGKVYDVDLEGKVIGAYDFEELSRLKSADGYDKLSAKTKNQLTNPTGLSAEILESNPELVSFLQKNNYSAVRAHLINGGGNELIVLNPTRAKIAGGAAKKAISYDEAVKTFRIAQEMTLRASGDDATLAARNFLQTYVDSGIDLKNVTPSQLYKDMNNWVQADQAWKKAVKQGIIPGMDKVEAARYTPVRWDAATRTAVSETVANAQSPQEALEAIAKMADQPGNGWGNNENLLKQIENIIKTSKNPEEARKAIRAINAASKLPAFIPKKVRDELARLGYTIAEPVGGRKVSSLDLEDTRKLVTGAIKGETDDFTETIIPNPGLASFAQFLEKTGMSPQSSNQVASKVLSENVIANLDNTTAAAIGLNTKGNVPKGGQQILQTLQQYVENKKGILGMGKAAVSDIRQLTYREVQEALPGLRLTRGQAKELSKAIMRGYLEVPLEFRGAGDKIVDALYRFNPLHKTYSRIQSAARYSYNPFFRVQERTETKILSHASAHNLIWNKPKAALDEVSRKLDESRIFTSSLYGEGAQDQVLGRITANITQGQKRDLAGLAMDIAEKKGMTIDDLINNHPDEIDDALRVIVQYGRKGVLASPLARTMNVAFFPMRYNAKVTMLAAKILAEEPAYIQKAVLHSMFKMGDWLQSEEGILWQQQHQDAIRLFNWITPVNSIAYTVNLLKNGADTPSGFGILGGLPIGVISQILDSQGVISLNTPYMDKKTGDVFPKYVPETTKARAATAITDLMGSMFTYPGRTLGLPGKGEGMRTVVKQFIATEGSDFEKRLDESKLTDLDRKWIKVIKDFEAGKENKDDINALYNSPAAGQFNWYTIPPSSLPFKVERRTGLPSRRTGLPSKKSGRKKKTKKIAIPLQ